MLLIYVSIRFGQSVISSSIHFIFIVISYLCRICYSTRSFFSSNLVFFLASFLFACGLLFTGCIGLISTPVQIVDLPLDYPLICFLLKNNLYRISFSNPNSFLNQVHQIYDYKIFYWRQFDFFFEELVIFLLICTQNDFLNLVDENRYLFSLFSLCLLVDLTLWFSYYFFQHNYSNF